MLILSFASIFFPVSPVLSLVAESKNISKSVEYFSSLLYVSISSEPFKNLVV
jgi:hypothetical protein